MADFPKDIRRLFDQARVNLDLRNDVYKSGLGAICFLPMPNYLLFLLFLQIKVGNYLNKLWSVKIKYVYQKFVAFFFFLVRF